MRFKYPTLKISINTTLLRGINDNYNSIQELVGFASSIKADLKIIEVYPKNSKYYTSIYKIEPLIKQMGYKNIKDSFRKNYFLTEFTTSFYKDVLVVLYLNRMIKLNFVGNIMIYILVKMEKLIYVELQMIL